MSYCFVPGCNTGYSSQRKVYKALGKKTPSIFSVKLKDYELLQKWRIAIRRKDKQFTFGDRVCSLHFKESDIEYHFTTVFPDGSIQKLEREKPFLKPGAVPSIFTTCSTEKLPKKKQMSVTKDPPAKQKALFRASTCFVPGCRTGYRTDRKKRKMEGKRALSMFSPPNDKSFELWKFAIRRKDRELSRNSPVCELHFPEECVERYYTFSSMPDGAIFKLKRGRAMLKQGSIPSIFPNYPIRSSTKVGEKPKRSRKISERISKSTNVTSSPKYVSVEETSNPVLKHNAVTNKFSNQCEMLENVENRNPLVQVVKQGQSDFEEAVLSTNVSEKDSLSPIIIENTALRSSINQLDLLKKIGNGNPYVKIIKLQQSVSEYLMSNLNCVSTSECLSQPLSDTVITELPNQPHLTADAEIVNSSAENVPAQKKPQTRLNKDGLSPYFTPNAPVCSSKEQSKSYMKKAYRNVSNHPVRSSASEISKNVAEDTSTSSNQHLAVNSDPVIALDTTEPTEKTLFDELKEGFKMPNNWGYIKCFPEIIACVKWDENYSVERKLVIDSQLNIKVFLGEREIILMEDMPRNIEQVSAILRKIDNIEICRGAADKEMPDCLAVMSAASESFVDCRLLFCDNCRAYKQRRARALWQRAISCVIAERNCPKQIVAFKGKNRRLKEKIKVLKRKLQIEEKCAAAALEFFA